MKRLVLALVLIAAQAIVVGLGLFAPRVSDMYRAYFIDHTIDVWPGLPGSTPMQGPGRPLRDSEMGPYQNR